MRLSVLLDPGMTVRGGDPATVEVTGLTCDSREIEPGMLFAALAGSRHDGRSFVTGAVANGAVAVLADPSLADPPLADLGVPLVVDPEPRRRLALMAARWYGRQPRWIGAITGTNGKTSVASFTRQLWSALDVRGAALGTLGLDAPDHPRSSGMAPGLTTPDPVRLHALVAELALAGVDHLVLEASSHGLDQHRLDGLRLQAAAFTNISRDHFDYHGSFADYLAAKRRLFEQLLPAGGTAVLNADQPEFEALEGLCRARGIDVLDYGERATHLRLVAHRPRPDGLDLTLAVAGEEHRVATRLVGDFQASNLLAALGLVLASGIEVRRAVPALERVRGAPGRLERVADTPAGAAVYVDYAHTPDALAKVLAALRPHIAGRLVVLFGCGGDRDRGKRAEMGAVAAKLADRTWITDDNPRSEDPAAIRAAILAACHGAVEVADRGAAIRAAIAELAAGDVLVVAGKGHETGQIVGAVTLPFDDAVEVRAALAGQPGDRQ